MSGLAGLGMCATFRNADPAAIAPLGVVRSLAVQIAWGAQPGPSMDLLPDWVARCRAHNLGVAAWAWCNASTVEAASAEGRYHAERCAATGLTGAFVANPEESYDAHGDSRSPRYLMVGAYVRAFTRRAAELRLPFRALGLTSTPRFASDMGEAIQAGWVGMPQAFPRAVPGATIAACLAHWQAWGWPLAQLRPLVQTYRTNNAYPDPRPFLDESAAANVGVVPYTVEQALDSEGRALLAALKPAVTRGEPTMEKIGSQSGIVASMNRLRDLDPAGTLLAKDATGKWPSLSTLDAVNLGHLKAWDKLERTLQILAADHDAQA